LVGVYAVSFALPAGAGGNQPLTLSIAGKTSNSVTMAVAGSPGPAINAVVNSSGSSTDAVAAPGTIVSIYACNFGSQTNLILCPATNFQGLSVTFNGTPGPLFAVAGAQGQINVLVPTELPDSGTVTVQIKTPTGSSPSFSLRMSPAAPGIFRVPDP